MRDSYSSISSFNKCQYSYYSRYIAKKWMFSKPTEALIKGTAVHNRIETLLHPYRKGHLSEYTDASKKPVTIDDPVIGKTAEKYIKKIVPFLKGADAVLVEFPLGVNKDGDPVDFKDPSAYLIGIGDLFVVKEGKCFYFDWKTGKGKYPDDYQLDIMSYLFLKSREAKFFGVTSVSSSLVYVEMDTIYPTTGYHVVDNETVHEVEERIRTNIEEKDDHVSSHVFTRSKTPLCNYCGSLICPFSISYNPLEKVEHE